MHKILSLLILLLFVTTLSANAASKKSAKAGVKKAAAKIAATKKVVAQRASFASVGCERDNVESVYFAMDEQGQCQMQMLDTEP